jgi:hypothetical protein
VGQSYQERDCMSEREKDLSLLETFCTKKRLPGLGVIAITLCTVVIIGLAMWSSFLGSAYLIVVALLSCMSLILILIQYYVAGPLFREVQRLKEEIDSLKTE